MEMKESSKFDEDTFKRRVLQHADEQGFELLGMWTAADGVYFARINHPELDEPCFIFYHDCRETQFRDDRYIDRGLSLIMVGGFTKGALSKDPNDHLRIFHFAGNFVGDFICSPDNALNCATQLLIDKAGEEIDWSKKPEPISLS